MMKYMLILIGILFLGSSSFAQIQVSGKVSNEAGDALPGTTILEKGTTNEIHSNYEGDFAIKCITESPILIFSFVGMETKEFVIKYDTTFNVILVEDNTPLGKVAFMGCFSRTYQYGIGLNTGLNHNQLGIETQNILPRLLSFLSFRNIIYSNFKYRFLTKNQYLKSEIGRHGILRIGDEVRLGLKANYQQISLENSGFSNRQFSVSTIIGIKRWNTSIGYARREVKNHEDLNNSQNGITFGLQKVFFRRLNFNANAIYWSEDWQYNLRLSANIPKTRIDLGLAYEKINDWEEFGVSVLYSFYYY